MHIPWPRMHPLAPFLVLFFAASTVCAAGPDGLVPYRVAAGEIREPLTRAPGDAQRGREIVTVRTLGACVTCHEVPGAGERSMGSVGPSLAGVGSRVSPGRLRLRLVDGTRINPDAAMPAYYRVAGLNRVAREYRGRPLLSAQQIEDAVAFLMTLK